MPPIQLIPFEEFERVREARLDRFDQLSIIAGMCRANTLAAVKRAGSGHLGSSFSAMDIVVWLYYEQMNTLQIGIESPDRDIYFSSKGHDVPGQYAVLHSLGVVPEDKLLQLRRLGGLDGHPDVHIPGIEANSGSLGMGISKGRGMAWAKRHAGQAGRVYVLLGDGELQEGQNYEALQATVQQGISNLTAIVDHNKLQSDKLVTQIVDLGDLEAKFRAFGWEVARCDGHDLRAIQKILREFQSVTDRPQILIADTIKGRGVSFMEHPTALAANNGSYRWHAGAPDDESFMAAHAEIIEHVNQQLHDAELDHLALRDATPPPSGPSGVSSEFVSVAYGRRLVELAPSHPELVVLDGDLALDCKIREFENAYPDQFIENGIAEQDMASMAGGLARAGYLPVVNSFASFLAARANEQIYNNATERTKIIYAGHYAGLIPAGPGKSHQSIRDISLMAALPNMTIMQPCNAEETRMVVDYCVKEAQENCYIRLVIGPSPRQIQLPDSYRLSLGQGVSLTEGTDAIVFGYGPVMLHEALVASEMLRERNFSLQVVDFPWLNRFDVAWLARILSSHSRVFVLEDHAPTGGLGSLLLDTLNRNGLLADRSVSIMGVEGYPACGTPAEALCAHQLDGASLAERMR